MKYSLLTKFWYDEDDDALARRLTAFFQTPWFRDAVLQPRSLKLPPTPENLARLLVPEKDLSTDFNWIVKRQGKPVSGRLCITRNRAWTPPGFTSFLDLKFSLSTGYKGGPFRDATEVRDAALACMLVGPSLIGLVETGDEGQERTSAKFELFRSIDDMAVPASIEWVTILHKEIVANLGVDLRRLKGVAGVRVDRCGDYWSLILCPEPFSFAEKVGVAALEQVTQELRLAEIHGRFKRAGNEGR